MYKKSQKIEEERKRERQRIDKRNRDCDKNMNIRIEYLFQTGTFKTETSYNIPSYHIKHLFCNNHRHSTLWNHCLQVPIYVSYSRLFEASGKKWACRD